MNTQPAYNDSLRRMIEEENKRPVRGRKGEWRIFQPDLVRFLNKTELAGGCWLWLGAKSRGRGNKAWYGSFWFAGRVIRAHKFAWIAFFGQVPCKGYHLDHVCRNSLCVNPWHLEHVTPRENSLRRWEYRVS